MKFKITVSILLSALLSISAVGIAGCSNSTEEVKTLTLDSLIEKVNEKNEVFIKRDISYDEAEYTADYEEIEFSDEEIKGLTSYDYNNVTKEEAKEDVDTFFRVLKSLYAGYTYFGGDEAFNRAKEEIKVNIDAYEKEKINQQAFTEIITGSLGFVKDSHFVVAGKQCFDEAHTYYESSRMNFFETESGYFTEIDGERYYLPKEYEKYLKVTIAESGELVYGIFAVVTGAEKEELPVQIEMTAGSKTKNVEIDWVLSEVGGDQAALAQYSEENLVAIPSLSDMILTEDNFAAVNEFLNNAKKHSEHEYSILDLRSNNGGSPDIDMMWIYGYTGEITDISYPQIAYMVEFYNKLEEYAGESQVIEPYAKLDIVTPELEANFTNKEYQSEIYTIDGMLDIKPEKLVSNPNTLFVLQSKRDVSAGEAFIMMLDGVENVLSVGTNTHGCIHTGNIFHLSLPNSGLQFMYSRSIIVDLEKDFDVYGLEPDIYIADDNAKDAVLRCIEYYS